MSPLDDVRAAGIVCPSCGKNYADLLGGHQYQFTPGADLASAAGQPDATVRCESGWPLKVVYMTFDEFRAVANIAFLDNNRRREAEAFAEYVAGEL